MKNLFFINEFATEKGRVLTGRDLDNDLLYHLEPLTIRRGGWGHRVLRDGIGERQTVAENENLSGILPVYGPFLHDQELFIGWKKRDGMSVWTDFHPIGKGEALLKFFKNVLPLMIGYRVYHRKGFVVGTPVWERFCLDSQGYYFPDPAFLSYIQKPDYKIPTGLAHCRAPENYRGNPPGPAGDIFYLGVFIYVALTGEIPFPLVHGWPTQALIRGDFIPLRMKRPDLNREAADSIDRMVNRYPECRPTCDQLAEKWQRFTNEHHGISLTKQDYLRNIRESKAYSMKRRITTIMRTCVNRRKLIIASAIIALTSVLLWFGLRKQPIYSPVEFAKQFYQETSNPASVIAQNKLMIVPDIVQEREKRLEAARKIVTQPLLELTGIRTMKGTGKVVVVEADVKCWRWSDTGWKKTNGRERLELIKKGRQWKIMKRILFNTG